MNKWAGRIKRVEKEIRKGREMGLAIIAANNHYVGFGPGTANMFRKMVGLSEISCTQTESIKKALPEALVRRKILLKNMMRKNNLEGITLALLCTVINYKTMQLGPIS
jgi:hypothetical protein